VLKPFGIKEGVRKVNVLKKRNSLKKDPFRTMGLPNLRELRGAHLRYY